MAVADALGRTGTRAAAGARAREVVRAAAGVKLRLELGVGLEILM